MASRPSTRADNNLLEGNKIGTDLSGLLVLGNRGNGVSLGSSGNSIGGLSSGAGNTIAFNGTGSVGAGVQLVGLVNQNSILSNSIHDNAGLGINLGNGPTPNHMPGTMGPNNYQNYPVLSAIQTNGSTTSLTGTLFGFPSSSYTVQIFWSPKPDPSGFGEGQTLLTTFSVSTDSTGNAAINLNLPAAPPPGSAISATATDSSGNTSEFSADAVAKAVTDLAVTIVATPNPVGVGNTLTYQVTVTNAGGLDAHDVVLTDQLPAKVAIVSTSASQGSTPTVSGRTVTASLGTVAANATATLTIVTTVLAGAGPSLSDSASVTLDEIDSNPSNNSATITTAVAPVADLSLTFSASPSTVRVGDTVTFTLTATNQGPSPATNVVVTLPLGGNVAFQSSSVTQGQANFNGGQVTASLGSLAAGAQATLTVIVQASSVGSLSFTATVSSDLRRASHRRLHAAMANPLSRPRRRYC